MRREPGLSRSQIAKRLGGRRAVALDVIGQAISAGVVQEARSLVRARAGQRSVTGLFAEAPATIKREQALPLGLELRPMREQFGLSARLVAEQLGVSVRLIYHWETGAQPVPAWAVDQLPEAFEAATRARALVNPASMRRRRARSGALRRLVEEHPGITVTELAEQLEISRADVRRRLSPLLLAGEVFAGEPARRSSARSRGLYAGAAPQPASAEDVAQLARAADAAGWTQERTARALGITQASWWGAVSGRRALPFYVGSDRVRAVTQEATERGSAAQEDLRQAIAAAVQEHPGVSRGRLAELFGRGKHIETALAQCLADGLVHYAPTPVASGRADRAPGALRFVQMLHPGPLEPSAGLSAEQLEDMRLARHISRADLGAAIGVSDAQVRAWELGQRPIPDAAAARLRVHLEQLEVHDKPWPRRRHSSPIPDSVVLEQALALVGEHPGITRTALVTHLPGDGARRGRVISGAIEAGLLTMRPVQGRRSDGRTFSAEGLYLA